MRTAPPLAFLGMCARAETVPALPGLAHLNVLGLRNTAVSFIYPLHLASGALLFAVYDANPEEEFEVLLRDPAGGQVGSLKLRFGSVDPQAHSKMSPAEKRMFAPASDGSWSVAPAPLVGEPRFLIASPGLYRLILRQPGGETSIGTLNFGLLHPEPLSPARIAAIKSQPDAARCVRLTFVCKTCRDLLRIYAGLEKGADPAANEYVWYADLPETFRCRCGAYTVDLRIVRANMHALLGQPLSDSDEVSIVRLYEGASISRIRVELLELLNSAQTEEELQVFLTNNYIVLHTISPAQQIFTKKPITTKFRCDFAILSPSRELLLVEIERQATPVIKADGGQTALLQHAFDQVHRWLQAADENRSAVLEGIGLERQQVGGIRAIVVAGRDAPHDSEQLRQFKARDHGRIKFFTYDDLVSGLGTLEQRLINK